MKQGALQNCSVETGKESQEVMRGPAFTVRKGRASSWFYLQPDHDGHLLHPPPTPSAGSRGSKGNPAGQRLHPGQAPGLHHTRRTQALPASPTLQPPLLPRRQRTACGRGSPPPGSGPAPPAPPPSLTKGSVPGGGVGTGKKAWTGAEGPGGRAPSQPRRSGRGLGPGASGPPPWWPGRAGGRDAGRRAQGQLPVPFPSPAWAWPQLPPILTLCPPAPAPSTCSTSCRARAGPRRPLLLPADPGTLGRRGRSRPVAPLPPPRTPQSAPAPAPAAALPVTRRDAGQRRCVGRKCPTFRPLCAGHAGISSSLRATQSL